ncbi:uncharacterized protein TRIVIDRAFT_64795 [Trichoderma virens Gv29-8]|uniref:DUF7730 domain-containing protein n=1 Tax=Hypocrea virens (strain Gv29-8 / FGSC 10586) TaxID=413071 RepID=G9NC62_HYPVG|nr:uncharacterized protein TRIVIDRAFT_64795 [Trichoderma virens Gv29-8]EHK15287.1 hypothetical protein TRIVIDRAFT_64795 [Trichoderma virens Gv29-8]UKZ51231.1 hypothetical protein TrVGV298_004988 [Trichoderma virens]
MKFNKGGPQAVRFELLQLLPEIRRLAYHHYFSNDNDMSRISTKYQPSTSVVVEKDEFVNGSQMTTTSRTATAAGLVSNINAIPLLSCSSQIYHEAIDVLYGDAPFYFDDMGAL